jgi:tetratricopeptide (TPR) repeat protein
MTPLPFPRSALLALTLVLCASCASVVHQPLLAPEKGGPAWTEVTSEHFVLKTDLDRDDAQQASAKLEEMYAALADLGFPSTQRPRMQIDVVYFRSHDDYALLAPKLSDGSFFPQGRHDFEGRPFALLGGDFVQAMRETLQHELTHLFVHYYYPQAPTWLNEGFARYMETMSIEDGVVVLGRQSRHHRFWKGPRKWQYDPSGGTLLLPMSEAPSPGELRRMSPTEFYGDRDLDPATSAGVNAAEVMGVHYEGAWSLVHMLLTNDSYSETFAKYLARIHDGDKEDAAWEQTLGRFLEAQLAKDYEAALVPQEVTLLRAKWRAPAYKPESVRPLTSSEVHVLWARLRPDTPEGQRAAEADLAETRKGNAQDTDADAALVEAYWLAKGAQTPEAEVALQEALAKHQDDARLWNALGRLTIRDTTDASGHLSPAGQKALAPIGAHLAPLAKSAAQLDLMANISSVNGDADASLSYEKRAVAIDPNCVTCLAQAATVLYAKGLVREALETATLALGLAPEGQRLPRVVELIETCRRRLAEPSDAPRAPASHGSGGKK